MSQALYFPNVPTHTPMLDKAPGYKSSEIKRNTLSESKRAELLRQQANITAIKEQLKTDKNLDRQLAAIRREDEARQRQQEAMDEAELYAEFEKLEKENSKDCKKNKDGKCTIMGGKYKIRKSRKNKRKGTQKSKNVKKRKTYRRK
jgi:hypothetical protein